MSAGSSRRLIALRLPPGEAFVTALVEAWAAGHAVLPVDPHAPAPAVESLLAAMQLDQPVDPDVALVIATSGSTGEPKGAQLTRAALDSSARACHDRIGRRPDDVWLSCLPWHHIGGLQVMLRARLLDIPVVIHERFDVERFAGAQATLTSLVPAQLVRLLDAGVDLTRFRVILLGGAAAPAALLARARAAGAPLVTTYGMSETAGGCVYDGLPLDGVEVRLTERGRIAIRGPVVMAGYRCRPDLTAASLSDGWLLSSDLGEYDELGRLQVTGRADDLIITGGENVDPAQVAAVIARHPAVAEVEVVGIPDDRWGQRVIAVMVAGGTAPSLAQLRDWCRELPVAARPQGLVIAPRLPTLSSGKLDRLALRRLAEVGD